MNIRFDKLKQFMLMCTRMLNTRAHILFEAEDYRLLEAEAAEKDSSVGELVRAAVKRVYVEPKAKQLSDRQKAFDRLKQWQKKIGTFKGLDYKALIEYGRKY